MTFNVSFNITDTSISLNELIAAGYTIKQAEFTVKKIISEILEDELGDEMNFAFLDVVCLD